MSAFLIDILIKSIVVLSITYAFTLLMRKRSAATRDAVWKTGFTALLLLPLFTLTMPTLETSWLPAQSWLNTQTTTAIAPDNPIHTPTTHNKTEPATTNTQTPPPLPSKHANQLTTHTPDNNQPDTPPAPAPTADHASQFTTASPTTSFDWKGIVVGVYITGLLISLLSIFTGIHRLKQIIHNATRIHDGPIINLTQSIAKQFGLKHKPIIMLTDDASIPMVTQSWFTSPGIVILPQDAHTWTPEQLEIVLMHELAHLHRKDCPMQLTSRILSAFYWPNPLIYLGLHRMQVEREQACDDLVLNHGSQPSTYAQSLLDIATTCRNVKYTGAAAVAMARTNELESRLHAILDAKRNRKTLTLGMTTLIAFTLLGVSASIAALQAEKPHQQGVDIATGEVEATKTVEQVKQADNPKQPTSDFIYRLPSGLEVELIGLAPNRSTPDSWWKPDGTPLKQAPFTADENGAWVGNHPDENIMGVEVAFTVRGQHPDTLSTSFRVEPYGGGRAGGGRIHLHNDLNDVYFGGAISVKNKNNQCTVELHVASETWKSIYANDGRSTRTISNSFGSVIFGDPLDTNEGLYCAVSHNISDQQVRLIAVTQDGEIITPTRQNWSRSGDLNQVEAKFKKHTLKDIVDIQFQTRRYEKVAFHNVSLEKGHKTKVTRELLTNYKDYHSQKMADKEIQNILNKHAAFKFNNLQFKYVINQLSRRTKLNILVNWNQLSTIGIKPTDEITLHITDTPYHQIFKKIFQSLTKNSGHLQYQIKDGNLYITAAAADHSTHGNTPATKTTLTKLQHPISIDFDQVSLREGIEQLRKKTDATIMVHWKDMQKAGVDDKDILVGFNVDNQPVSKVLELFLLHFTHKNAKLYYTIENGVVNIRAKTT